MKTRINLDELHNQLCNALEAEQGSIRIYQQAAQLAADPALHRRCAMALDDARRNENALLSILAELGFDAAADSPCRRSVRQVGDALVAAMRAAPVATRQKIVAECVQLADARERGNWELFGQLLSVNSTHRAQSSAAVDTPRANAPRRSHDWLSHAVHARADRSSRSSRPRARPAASVA
jgi:hypothetical protein